MAFKMKGSPMQRNFGVESSMKQTHTRMTSADPDMIMSNQQELDEATKQMKTDLRKYENELDWATDARNKKSDYLKDSAINRAKENYWASWNRMKELEKTQAEYTKKGSGKPGPYEGGTY